MNTTPTSTPTPTPITAEERAKRILSLVILLVTGVAAWHFWLGPAYRHAGNDGCLAP